MKSFTARIIPLFLVIVMIFTLVGCNANVPEENQNVEASSPTSEVQSSKVNEFEVLRQAIDEYLKQDKQWTISAEELYKKVILGGDQSYYIVDIRGNSHYAAAHIPGSVNIPYAETWKRLKTELLPKDKKIVLVCYSGHTSSQTTVFWNMLGYDVVSLKNGMSSWSKNQGVIGSSPLACEPFDFPVVSEVPGNKTYKLATVNEGLNDIESLLHKRSEAYLTAGLKPVILSQELNEKINNGTVKQELFLLDIRNKSHYNAGHIKESINIPLKEIAEVENLKKLPTNKKIVVIGYDGHDASQIVRLLAQLGYNATALKDGMRIWNSDEQVIGTKAISCTSVKELPTQKLNYIPKTDSAPATCGG